MYFNTWYNPILSIVQIFTLLKLKLNRQTTHAILIGDAQKSETESAMAMGVVVVSEKWLDVCTIHNELIPGNLT